MSDRLSPLDSVKTCITASARDWSLESNDAWMYGIVCGWSAEALTELIQRHGWSDKDVTRLRLLRMSWENTNRVIKEQK